MNRKKTSKVTQERTKQINRLSVFDDPAQWLGESFTTAPWTDAQIAEYQKKIDSAFGAENAIRLAWSGDERYWDEFAVEWNSMGVATKFKKVPNLLLLDQPVAPGSDDYVRIQVPRWTLLERLHPSELEASWQVWDDADEYLGGKKQLRKKQPPSEYWHVLATLAEHEQPVITGAPFPCCERMWHGGKLMCFGKYRPPSEADLLKVRAMRTAMDKDGVAQRNDQPRSQKLRARAQALTQHYMNQAKRQRATAVKELIMSDPQSYFRDVIKDRGITLSAKEIDLAVLEGLNIAEDKRFESGDLV